MYFLKLTNADPYIPYKFHNINPRQIVGIWTSYHLDKTRDFTGVMLSNGVTIQVKETEEEVEQKCKAY